MIFLILTRSLAFMSTLGPTDKNPYGYCRNEIPTFLTLEKLLPIPASHMDPTVSVVPTVTTVPTVHTIPKFF
jgi:hypothetical protein